VAQQLKAGIGLLIVEVSKSLIITHTRTHARAHARTHTHTHTHTWYDSSEPVISPSQRPLPTQHTTNRGDDHSLDSNPRSQQSSSCSPTP